jgi:transposase
VAIETGGSGKAEGFADGESADHQQAARLCHNSGRQVLSFFSGRFMMGCRVLERNPAMAFRQSERCQQRFLPPSIEEYVPEDDPVRAYDVFVDTLDWKALGIVADEHQAGCPAYHPKTMLKILVYGYSYGIRSSRKLERAVHHNLSFIWIAGGLQPNFKTISLFRQIPLGALKDVLKPCARLCLKLDVIAGHTLFVEGSKFRANAGNNPSCTAEPCDPQIQQIDQRIDEILKACERVDAQEAQEDSMGHLKREWVEQKSRKERIEKAVAPLKAEGLPRVNTTDPDCARMHGRQGSHAGYNSQIVADDQHGLIVHSDVVNDNHDRKPFAEQIKAAQEITGKVPEVAGADCGYYSGPELEKRAAVATTVLVPARGQVHPAPEQDNGRYDRDVTQPGSLPLPPRDFTLVVPRFCRTPRRGVPPNNCLTRAIANHSIGLVAHGGAGDRC